MDTPGLLDGLQRHGGSALLRGTALLTDPLLNKGTAFTELEREVDGSRLAV